MIHSLQESPSKTNTLLMQEVENVVLYESEIQN